VRTFRYLIVPHYKGLIHLSGDGQLECPVVLIESKLEFEVQLT